MDTKIIKEELVKSVIYGNSKRFIPYLLCKNVRTEMPNKTRFYSFFEQMIKCGRQKSIGNLTLKIEKTNWNKGQNTLAYNFYDEQHSHARLSIMITEQNDKLTLETMPF